MADREIRIPIKIELQASGSGGKRTTKTSDTNQKTTQDTTKTIEKKSSNIGDALSAGLLIESSKKLLSATGNTEMSSAIEKTVKYGTLIARSVTGDVTAMVTLAVELGATALMKVQELKQEAQINNDAMYNKILTGEVYLGSSNISVSKDIWGNKTYNTR